MPALRHETLALTSRLRHHSPNFYDSRRRNRSNFNRRCNQHHSPQQYRQHHNRPSGSRTMVAKFPSRSLVMGEVKILKRGEPLSKYDNQWQIEKDTDLILGSTDRIGPDPETVKKQITVRVNVNNIYAGSAFISTSPPPSSVPVPGFLSGKNCNGAATSDLRRLLGI